MLAVFIANIAGAEGIEKALSATVTSSKLIATQIDKLESIGYVKYVDR